MTEDLITLRQEITAIDQAIIGLLRERSAIVDRVAITKRAENPNGCLISPARESLMLKEIVSSVADFFPPAAAIAIWRAIITAANAQEEELIIGIYNPLNKSDYFYLAREYYGSWIEVHQHNSITALLQELDQDLIKVAIIPYQEELERRDWWIRMVNNKENIYIFAAIPAIIYQNIDHELPYLLAAGKVIPENSGDNASLAVLEVGSNIQDATVVRALSETNLAARILANRLSDNVDQKRFYLLELDGFYSNMSEEVMSGLALYLGTDCYMSIIGSFAKPISL